MRQFKKKFSDISKIEFNYLQKRSNHKKITFDDVYQSIASISKFLERQPPPQSQVDKITDDYQFIINNGDNQAPLDYDTYYDICFEVFETSEENSVGGDDSVKHLTQNYGTIMDESHNSQKIQHNFNSLSKRAKKQGDFMNKLDTFIKTQKNLEDESMSSSKQNPYAPRYQQINRIGSLDQSRNSQMGTSRSVERYYQNSRTYFDKLGSRTVVTSIQPLSKEDILIKDQQRQKIQEQLLKLNKNQFNKGNFKSNNNSMANSFAKKQILPNLNFMSMSAHNKKIPKIQNQDIVSDSRKNPEIYPQYAMAKNILNNGLQSTYGGIKTDIISESDKKNNMQDSPSTKEKILKNKINLSKNYDSTNNSLMKFSLNKIKERDNNFTHYKSSLMKKSQKRNSVFMSNSKNIIYQTFA